MKLYVMRHGKTCWNERRIIQGRSQNRLSKFGVAQTEKKAQEFKDVKFDIIFCSPLFRAVQTANIMNRFHNVKVVKDDRIIENDTGIFTGRKRSSITPEEQEFYFKHPKEAGRETSEHVFERIKNFLDFLKKNYSDKTVLVVTHGYSAEVIYNCFEWKKWKNVDRFETTFANADIKLLDLYKKSDNQSQKAKEGEEIWLLEKL